MFLDKGGQKEVVIISLSNVFDSVNHNLYDRTCFDGFDESQHKFMHLYQAKNKTNNNNKILTVVNGKILNQV